MQEIATPDVLYSEVLEVQVRVVPALAEKCKMSKNGWEKVQGSTGESFYIIQQLNELKLKEDLIRLKKNGITSLAVVLMHGYT